MESSSIPYCLRDRKSLLSNANEPFLIRSTLKAYNRQSYDSPPLVAIKRQTFKFALCLPSRQIIWRDVKVETRKIKSNAPRKTLFIVPESLMITKQNGEVFNYFPLYLCSDYLPFVSFFLPPSNAKSMWSQPTQQPPRIQRSEWPPWEDAPDPGSTSLTL